MNCKTKMGEKNMKKLTIIAALAMVACVSAFTFTGCGGSKTTSEGSKAEESSKTEESMVDGKYVSIEACLADPAFQAALNNTDTDEYSVAIKGEDNKLIYEYTYKIMIEDVDAQKESIAKISETESVKGAMVNVANGLKSFVHVENPCVVARYINMDGTLIYEATYEADAE